MLISIFCKLPSETNITDIFLLIEFISEKKLIIFSNKFSLTKTTSILFSIIESLMLSRLFLKNFPLYKSLKYLFNRNKKLSSESTNKILIIISYFY